MSVAWMICFICPYDRVFGLVVEHPPLTPKARVRFPGRIIPKTLKMEPSVVVRGDPQKHLSKGKQASDPQLHGKKAVAGST